MWFMMGYYIGNGLIEEIKNDERGQNKIKFIINIEDEKYVVNRINNILKLTNKNCFSGYKYNKYECNDFIWYNIFRQFGKYVHNKIIPEWVQDAPKEYIDEFINGYRATNECICKDEYHSFTTVSYNLAFGLQRLYLKLGNLVSIIKIIHPKTTIIENNIVNQIDTYKIYDHIEENNEKFLSFIESGYAWYSPLNVDKIDIKDEIVYNFEVENDNSYIVENTIVHNCQPFSVAGVQKGFDDPRSNIYWKILEIIKYHKPSCVILENVKNLENHDKGKTFQTIKNSLIKEKYYIQHKILNTSKVTYIPQNRERIYIVCFKDKKLATEFNFDFKLDEIKKKPIKSILETETIPDKYYYNDKENKIHKMVLENVSSDKTVYQFRRVYVRENQNNECPTLTANMGTGGHNVPIILDKKGPRKLTPRECFNFQGFPQTYTLPKLSDSRLYKLAGNAVSVPVVELLVDKIVPLLDK